MSKTKNEKKDLALRLYEMFEDEARLTHEYITECLNEIKPRYLSSVNSATEKHCCDFLDDDSTHVKLWSFLDGIASDKDTDTQKKNTAAWEKLMSNYLTEDTIARLLHVIDKSDLLVQFHPLTRVNFSTRIYDHNLLEGTFGHAVGYFKFAGDNTKHWFESSGNEIMDIEIMTSVSGDTEEPPGDTEGYLKIMTENHEQFIYELDEFKMLAYSDYIDECKFALFSVFSKKLRLLYTDTVLGRNGFDSAAIRPMTALNNAFVPYQPLRLFKKGEKVN